MYSNLATPYGRAIYKLRGDQSDATVFSYRVNAAKPNPAIYQIVCNHFSLMPRKILMLGDSCEADVAGPLALGMQALRLALDCHKVYSNDLASLFEVLDVVEAQAK